MATERIQIIISSKGAVTVKRDIDEVGKAAKTARSGVDMLRSALGAVATVLSVQALISYADAGTRIANSLRVAGLEGEQFAISQDRLYKTAIRNGQSAEALAAVYQKTSLVQKELGISGEGVIDAIEGIAAAMKLSTAGTSAQAGALQQLSQLLGGSIVQAQEYNSLIDGAFPLVQAAARGIDGMEGSVAKLTQAIKAGGFSSKVFFEGLMKGLQDTRALAASLPLTVGQSVVALQQAFTQWLTTSTAVNFVMKGLAMVLQLMAANMDLTVLALTPLIAALVFLAGELVIGLVITGFTGMATILTQTLIPAVIKLNALLWANPYLLVAAAIAAVIAALVYWRKELGVTDDRLRAVWKTGVAAFNAIWSAIESGWAIVEPVFVALYELLETIWAIVKDKIWPVFEGFFDWLRPVLRDVVAGWQKLYDWFVYIDKFITTKLIGAFHNLAENIKADIQSVIDYVVDLINRLKAALSLWSKVGGAGASGAVGGGGGAAAPGMREGGQFMVGGTGGGTDNTPVRFNANRGERVTVETRKQQRDNDNGKQMAAAAANVNVPVNVVTVFDPNMVPTAMGSAKGQRTIVTSIADNRDEILRILGTS